MGSSNVKIVIEFKTRIFWIFICESLSWTGDKKTTLTQDILTNVCISQRLGKILRPDPE